MSSPYTAEFQVFADGTNATATAALPGDGHWAGSVDLSFTGTGFTGTFDFQGRPHESAEWQNIPYAVLDDSPAVSVAQVSLTTSSATIVYTLIRPMPYMRVVMTRSAGTFKMLGRYTGNVAGLNLETVLGAGTNNIGDVDVLSTVPPTPSAAAGVASSHYHPITQVTKANLKASAGNVVKFRATNENAATRFIQLHNKATAPAGTDVPVLSWKIPVGSATSPGYIEFEFKFARQFSTGIGVAISTTQATFTDSATATDHEIFVEYV